jgi:NAD(P)H dehydrogenase (quinone)
MAEATALYIFRGRRAMLSLTTGGPENTYVRGGFSGDISAILRPLPRGMLWFMGFEVLAPQIAYAPAHLSDARRVEILGKYSRRLRGIESETSTEIGDN